MKAVAYKKVVIKVGTNVLTRGDGMPDLAVIEHIAGQVAEMKRSGTHVILVSSGAVGAGRSLMPGLDDLSRVVRRQVLASLGQVKLMQIYDSFFGPKGFFCAQVLATKEDFRDRQHYINMKSCFLALQRDNIVPIVNENDVIAIDELMFTDNDELAGLVAAMTGADALLILTNVDGIYDGHPDSPDSRLLAEIDPDDKAVAARILPVKSSFGRGGMQTKLRIARKTAGVGIETFILNGKKKDIITTVLTGGKAGTRIIPKAQLSNIKKWIVFNDIAYKGQVVVNDGAVSALLSEQAVTSLLPVGIIRIEGSFMKGDLIQICNQGGDLIGLGIARYDAENARRWIGETGRKPLVHYDYLFIEKSIKE